MRLAAWMRALLFALVCLVPVGCGVKAEKTKETKKRGEAEPEVTIEDIVIGTGPAVEKGDWVEVHYTGTLSNGTQFGSSLERQEPFTFRVGRGQAIPGFDKGMIGMKEGGRRRITVPSALGYGTRGTENVPPNATLIFDVELLKVTK